MTKFAWLAGAAAIALAAAAVQAAPAVNMGKFKDWRTACDNAGDCMAIGFTEGEYVVGPYLVVRRESGPDAQPLYSIVLNAENLEVKEDDPVTVKVIGGPPAFTMRAEAIPGDSAARVEVAGRDGAGLLEAIKAGKAIEVEVNGQAIGQVSLAGSSAALRWIDDRQGRAGGVTALVAKGPKPASAVPAARTAPVIQLAPAINQDNLPTAFPAALARRADVEACVEEHADPEGEFGKPEVEARLSATEYLWGVPCGRGAYNFSTHYIIARADGSGARSPGLGDDDTVVNGGYDPEGRKLGAFNKGRGFGDCGTDDEWAWNGQRFMATRHAEMDDCRAVGTENWLVTWQANTR